MPTKHKAAAGECLVSIAAGNGFDQWRKLYDHGDNAPLRELRKFPPMLLPGDEVVLPDHAPKQVPAPTNKRHRFEVRVMKARLAFSLCAKPGARYQLAVGAETKEGEAAEATPVELPIASHETKGTLTVIVKDDLGERTTELPLAIGHLAPPDTVAGVQARLTNLGLYWGPVDGVLSRATRNAVARFQTAEGLAVTGDPEQATMDALRTKHDGG